jgi:hypothetical protein
MARRRARRALVVSTEPWLMLCPMPAGTHAAASATPEVRAALQELLLRRSRWMMVLTAGAVAVFIAVTHAIGSARPWTDLMNVGVGALLTAGLVLTRLAVVQQHIVALCVVLAVLFVGVRAVAGVWQGDVVATAIFMVAMGLLVAAAVPWGGCGRS